MADEIWSPPHAPHITATYPRRVWDPVEKKHEPQIVKLRCSMCSAEHQVTCEQGRPREHAMTFAQVHLHRDALAP